MCSYIYLTHWVPERVAPWVTGSTSSVDVLGHKRVLYKKKRL